MQPFPQTNVYFLSHLCTELYAPLRGQRNRESSNAHQLKTSNLTDQKILKVHNNYKIASHVFVLAVHPIYTTSKYSFINKLSFRQGSKIMHMWKLETSTPRKSLTLQDSCTLSTLHILLSTLSFHPPTSNILSNVSYQKGHESVTVSPSFFIFG